MNESEGGKYLNNIFSEKLVHIKILYWIFSHFLMNEENKTKMIDS